MTNYEPGPQGNRAWLAQKFAAIDRAIEEALRAARAAGARGGSVTGTLLVVTPHANDQSPTLIRRGSLVSTFNFRVRAGGAISADGVVATLPPGFRPALNGADALFTGQRGTSSGWVAQGFYLRADGTIRLLQTGAASGDVCAALVPSFPAGS